MVCLVFNAFWHNFFLILVYDKCSNGDVINYKNKELCDHKTTEISKTGTEEMSIIPERSITHMAKTIMVQTVTMIIIITAITITAIGTTNIQQGLMAGTATTIVATQADLTMKAAMIITAAVTIIMIIMKGITKAVIFFSVPVT